jgi:hypothetical protein
VIIAEVFPEIADATNAEAIARGVRAQVIIQVEPRRPGCLLVDEAELLRLLFRLDRLDAEPEGLVGDLGRLARAEAARR